MPKSRSLRSANSPLMGFFFVVFITAGVSVTATILFTSMMFFHSWRTSIQPATSTSTTDLVQSYLHSPFRILRTMITPDQKQMLVLATERNAEDDSCGGLYVSRTCYVFMEPMATSDALPVHLVTSWSTNDVHDYGAIVPNTAINFVGKDRIRFTATEDYAGGGIKNLIELNYLTGEMKIIDHQQFNPPADSQF